MKARQVSGFLALAALLAAGVLGYGRQGSEQRAAAPPSPPVAAPAAAQRTQAKAVPQGSGFDFYVLALSWSPTFCQSGEARDGDPQCQPGKPRGFVVHGLWPQHERGYPQFCKSSEPERVPAAIGRELAAFMPSMGLIGHQWRKHGSCTGLSQKDYFGLLAQAYQRIALPAAYRDGRNAMNDSPAQIEAAFISANPGLSPGAIAVTCDSKKLDEVRICMNKDLAFRACGEVDRQSCRINSISIPASR